MVRDRVRHLLLGRGLGIGLGGMGWGSVLGFAARLALMRVAIEAHHISPISRLYLAYISAISRLDARRHRGALLVVLRRERRVAQHLRDELGAVDWRRGVGGAHLGVGRGRGLGLGSGSGLG